MRRQTLPQTSVIDTFYNIFPAAAGRYQSAGGRSLNPIQKRRRRRVFYQTLASAYATFAGRYPEWTAVLFDENFLTGKVAPILESYQNSVLAPDPRELANAWADQLWLSKETRRTLLAELTPIAADFLRLLER